MAKVEWRTEGSVDEYVAAPPAAVHAAVSDVTRHGDRSSEVQSAEWLPGSEPGAVGARFRGRNRSGLARWSRVCEVTTNDVGARFAFRTVPERIDFTRKDSTEWSYAFVAEGDGTRVTHSYEIVKLPPKALMALYGRVFPHHKDMRPQMQETLFALQKSLET
jgi:hypothetical protein